jgi:hypothetical protein
MSKHTTVWIHYETQKRKATGCESVGILNYLTKRSFDPVVSFESMKGLVSIFLVLDNDDSDAKAAP